MVEQINLKVVGGLGDVALTRKYPAFCTNGLKDIFALQSVADIHDSSRLSTPIKTEDLLDEIDRIRLKGKFNPIVKEFLKDGFSKKLIDYHQLDKDKPELTKKFFAGDQRRTVIDISTPNVYHVPIAKQILTGSNCHILIEKPIATSLEEAIEFESFLKQKGNSLDQRRLMDAEHYSHYGNIMAYLYHLKSFCDDSLGNYGLGKVTGLELCIEEDEGFESERNQDIIEIAKSGGGLWLDTGIHTVGFLRNLGLNMDYNSIKAQPRKCADPRIADNKYGETSMEVEVDLIPSNTDYFLNPCHAKISVGKGFQERKKLFKSHHENGYVEIDIAARTLTTYNRNDKELFEFSFQRDAFYNVFDDLRKSVLYKQVPMTSVRKAIANVKDIFTVYDKANPIILDIGGPGHGKQAN